MMTYNLLFIVALSALLSSGVAWEDYCSVNTFQINGNGLLNVNPDIVRLTIAVTGKGSSASKSLSDLNGKIKSLLLIFFSLNIPSISYSATNIQISQNYDYSTYPSKLIGYISTQEFDLTLTNFKIFQKLLQLLAKGNFTVETLIFDIADKKSALQKARKASFVDASTKFSQYLNLTSLKNVKLEKIYALSSQINPFYVNNPNYYWLFGSLTPPSPIQVSAIVQATWKVKK